MKTNPLFRIKNIFLMLALSGLTLLAACGSGSSSSGGSSIAASTKSSTLVFDITGIDGTAYVQPKQASQEPQLLFARIVNSLVSTANAAHIAITIEGVEYVTDENESLLVPVSAGTYIVTFTADETVTTSCTAEISVGEDQIIYWDDIKLKVKEDGCEVEYDVRVDDSGEDEVDEDNDDESEQPAGKELVCHKDKKTLSISSSAVAAHLAHGDVTGKCAG